MSYSSVSVFDECPLRLMQYLLPQYAGSWHLYAAVLLSWLPFLIAHNSQAHSHTHTYTTIRQSQATTHHTLRTSITFTSPSITPSTRQSAAMDYMGGNYNGTAPGTPGRLLWLQYVKQIRSQHITDHRLHNGNTPGYAAEMKVRRHSYKQAWQWWDRCGATVYGGK